MVGQVRWCHCCPCFDSRLGDVTFRYGLHRSQGFTPDPLIADLGRGLWLFHKQTR